MTPDLPVPRVLHRVLAAAAVVVALAPAAVHAADGVYKCSSGGRVAYQAHPCDAARQGARGDEQDLSGLFARVRASEQELTALEQARSAQMQALEKKRRRAVDPAPVAAQIALVERDWAQRLAATRARREAALATIRTRCPRGASETDGRTSCAR